MTDTSALENLKYAHAIDVSLDLSSQEVHELWGEIETRDKRVAELGLELGRKSVELGELVGRNIIWEVINDELKSRRENLERENDRLQEKVSDLLKRIVKLEAENDQLTAHDATERQDDKCSKQEPNVCEACGGDGTVLLRDGYEGQVIATAKCTYCNGTGRVNKEREE